MNVVRNPWSAANLALGLCAMLFAVCFSAQAQQPKKVPRIGFLVGESASLAAPRTQAFRQGLRELGYVEQKNIAIEYRYSEGKRDRIPELAAELVRLEVDVIVTGGAPYTRAAKEATSTIPIVITQDPDPVGNGFVASLARPGGHITGLSNFNRELSGKRLELLKEVVPKLSRVAVFGTSTFPGNGQNLKETELAAEALRVKLQYIDVLGRKDLATSFRAATKARADAVIAMGSNVLNSQRAQVIALAAKSRLPAIYSNPQFAEEGGLMIYGVSQNDLARRAATYVDKNPQGCQTRRLPIEQPTKFELIINLKTAKQIGLTIPPNVLARADRVIK